MPDRDHPVAHFDAVAASYARHRPTYPEALFDWLAAVAPGRGLAWDCATGNGQAALPLAARFDRVVATDLSAGQLAAAAAHPRVEYRVAPAEASGVPDESCDLVTVAQALHWLDMDAFGREVTRVLVPGGVVAAWSYGLLACTPAVDAVVRELHDELLGPWWHPGRRHVENGYADLALPGEPVAPPPFVIARRWTLDELLGYLGTWSAVQRWREANGGDDPVALVRGRLAAAWGDAAVEREVAWPLVVKAARRVPAA